MKGIKLDCSVSAMMNKNNNNAFDVVPASSIAIPAQAGTQVILFFVSYPAVTSRRAIRLDATIQT